ncbi:hypothetical protein Trydic_g4108 [Trypoxylus dichotomus]
MTGVGDNLATCSAIFSQDGEDVVFVLDPKSTAVTKPDDFEDEYNLSGRMTSLGKNLCGFKLINSSFNDPTSWTLAVTDAFDNYNEAKFQVSQYEYEHEVLYSSYKVIPGLSRTITCGYQYNPKDFCKIFNPSGEMVSNTACSYSVVVTIEDIGKWRCLASLHYTMEPIEFIIELILDVPISADGWAIEEDDHYRLGCQIINDIVLPTISYCVITSPNGDDFIIRPSRATERYTTLSTNFDNRICGMEIPKPLEEKERGIWKCKVGDWRHNLYLGNNTEIEEPIPDYERNFTIRTNLGSHLDIFCEVPYSASYCHITSPYGTRYNSSSTTANLVRIGQCWISIPFLSEEHAGTWICSFARENEHLLDDIRVEVKIIDLLVYNRELEADEGEDVDVVCRSTGEPGIPVAKCLFTSPTNVSYYIYETLNTSEIVYTGRGFDYGDCSIRLNNIQSKHFGNWTCGVFYVTSNSESRIILLTEKPILSGT